MVQTTASRPKCFRIPKLAWCIWALWAAFNIWALLQVGINSTVLGRLTAQVLLPLIAPFIITWPLWFIFRRSQRVASILFSVLMVLVILSQLNTATHPRTSGTDAASSTNPST